MSSHHTSDDEQQKDFQINDYNAVGPIRKTGFLTVKKWVIQFLIHFISFIHSLFIY